MADKQLTGVYLLYSCRGRTCPACNINRKQVLAGKLRAGHARPLRLNNVLPCNNGTRPRNGQDRSLQSTRGPRSVGRGLDPSAAAVCHCDAVRAGHIRPLQSGILNGYLFLARAVVALTTPVAVTLKPDGVLRQLGVKALGDLHHQGALHPLAEHLAAVLVGAVEIGRASCRERV